jgi:hypothetical protein
MIPFNGRRISQVNNPYDRRNYLPNLDRFRYQGEEQAQQDQRLPISQPGANERFGQNVQLPTYQMPRNAPPPDFMGDFTKANANRPNRLAYQQAVQEGSPEIPKSRMQRLGAALAGAGVSWGTGDMRQGQALAESIFDKPQARADYEYERKVKNLASLAQFEDSDKANEIRALEQRQQDYWKKLEAERAERGEDRADLDQKRAERFTDIQIKNIESEMENRGWHITEGDDGWTYRVNNDGVRIPLIKSSASRDEKFAELQRELGERDKWEAKGDYRRIEGQKEVAKIGTESRERTNAADNEARLAAIRARNEATMARTAASLKPGDVNGGVWTEVAEAWSADPELKGYAMDDLLESIKTGSGPDIITAKKDVPYKESYGGYVKEGDDAKTIAAKNKLRQLLAKAYAKRGVQVPNTPAAPAGKGGDKDPLGIR